MRPVPAKLRQPLGKSGAGERGGSGARSSPGPARREGGRAAASRRGRLLAAGGLGSAGQAASVVWGRCLGSLGSSVFSFVQGKGIKKKKRR